ncbi:hypothetical protein [Arthrobacter methylotrophus]|uniref:hypothetical protein n=1 Tax=Arthrobacter methylotrophus TaxID=121291 RepID=UPI0031E73BE8
MWESLRFMRVVQLRTNPPNWRDRSGGATMTTSTVGHNGLLGLNQNADAVHIS